MRRPPPIAELINFPVSGGVCLVAIVATLCNFAHYNIEPLTTNYLAFHGEPWRLISSIFPHVSPLHLIFNVYWTWVFGSIVESTYGSLRTALLMALLAAGSSAAEYAFAGGGIGLSGVGYGLFGFLWVLSRYHPELRDAVDKNTVSLFIIWFFICIVLTISGQLPVANVAHGVGCGLGVLFGFAVSGPKRLRLIPRFALPICAVLIVLCATTGRVCPRQGDEGSQGAEW